jgi:hypothetical protein
MTEKRGSNQLKMAENWQDSPKEKAEHMNA